MIEYHSSSAKQLEQNKHMGPFVMVSLVEKVTGPVTSDGLSADAGISMGQWTVIPLSTLFQVACAHGPGGIGHLLYEMTEWTLKPCVQPPLSMYFPQSHLFGSTITSPLSAA